MEERAEGQESCSYPMQSLLPSGTVHWQLTPPKGAFGSGERDDGSQPLLSLPSELCLSPEESLVSLRFIFGLYFSLCFLYFSLVFQRFHTPGLSVAQPLHSQFFLPFLTPVIDLCQETWFFFFPI